MKKSDLISSALSAILWVLSAMFSFGTANTYLTDPNIPLDVKAHWVHYLWTGIFFGVIGVMNIASVYCLTRLRKKVSRQRISNAPE